MTDVARYVIGSFCGCMAVIAAVGAWGSLTDDCWIGDRCGQFCNVGISLLYTAGFSVGAVALFVA